MTLYHFTADHLARKIAREGITKGGVSLFNSKGQLYGVERGMIWLTSDGSWIQPWHSCYTIPYDRTAVRFTVDIPRTSEHLCFHAIGLIAERWPHSVEPLTRVPGSENWYLYTGKVFRKWLTETHVKEFTC